VGPDLVVLGNLLVDDLVFPDGRTRMSEPGGATLYAALGAALWGLHTGVVSWRGRDYPAWALEAVAARGIELDGVHDLGRPGARTWLLYEGARRQIVHRLDRPSHAEVSPAADRIPDAWKEARAFHLAPMPFPVQKALVESLSAREGAFLSLDPFLLLRRETLPAFREVLARVDAFFLSEDEMELEGAREDPRPALRSLTGGRLRYVVFKRGLRGGLLLDVRGDRFVEWAARGEAVDPTGAGDAFAGGLLAGWLQGDTQERALQRAIVAASFAIADWGPAGLLGATPERARARLKEWSPP
jgi:sugar/nucleoside kinase (ribokinase family)